VLAQALPPTGDAFSGDGGPPVALLVIMGTAAFAAGIFAVALAARKPEEEEVYLDE
jgi:hypothetical protein